MINNIIGSIPSRFFPKSIIDISVFDYHTVFCPRKTSRVKTGVSNNNINFYPIPNPLDKYNLQSALQQFLFCIYF